MQFVNFSSLSIIYTRQKDVISTKNNDFKTSNVCISKLSNYNQVENNRISFCGKRIKVKLLNTNTGIYKKEKDLINQILLEPIAYNDCGRIPSSVLLGFGDISASKNIIEDIKQKINAEVVVLSDFDSKITEKMDNILDSARKRYLRYEERTIVIINDADKFLGMTPVEAKKYEDFNIDNKDLKYLESLGNNTGTINYFKSLLDNVKNIPKHFHDTSNSAATILMISTNPQLIHPDLYTRSGKVKTVIFPVLKGKNLNEAIKIETLKMSKLLDDINTDYNLDNLDGIKILSDKHKQIIKELKSKYKLNNLTIDYENIPFYKIIKFVNQSKEKGTFSQINLQDISQKAFRDYLEEPTVPYSMHFVFNLSTNNRDISFEQIQKYKNIQKFLLGPQFTKQKIQELKEILGLFNTKSRKNR